MMWVRGVGGKAGAWHSKNSHLALKTLTWHSDSHLALKVLKGQALHVDAGVEGDREAEHVGEL